MMSESALVKHDCALNLAVLKKLVELIPNDVRLHAKGFGELSYRTGPSGCKDSENL
jgi:hypothetical protein